MAEVRRAHHSVGADPCGGAIAVDLRRERAKAVFSLVVALDGDVQVQLLARNTARDL